MKKVALIRATLSKKLKRHVETCRFMFLITTLDITFWLLKKSATLQNFQIFLSQVSTITIRCHYLLRPTFMRQKYIYGLSVLLN